MSEEKIRELLIKRSHDNYKEPDTDPPDDDYKISYDLKEYPHAFVIASIVNRQISGDKAWGIPDKLAARLGDFSFATLKALSLEKMLELMSIPNPLHRYPKLMSECLVAAIDRIEKEYNGDTPRIWANNPSSAEVVYRFLQFKGVGRKIATLAANMLVRNFEILMSDYYSIDVSIDIHIRLVFKRLGLVSENADDDEITYKARSINPEYPGILDYRAWEIGHNWCKPKTPRCQDCYMREVCPSSRA